MCFKRWKPKLMQPYWCIQENCASDAPELRVCFVHEWQGTFHEVLLFKAGLVFKTEIEARTALPLAAEEIGWGYEL